MAGISDSNRRKAAISLSGVVGFVIALGLSTLILNLWGDHIAVRAVLGLAWGGYCLWAFGPDLMHFIRHDKNQGTKPGH